MKKIYGSEIGKNVAIVGLAAMIMIMCVSCGRRGKPDTNILLVTLDTTRADHLGCYGYTQADTPFLDQLAAEGMLFERAYTCVPLTLPAHASILTGLLPPEHGLRVNGQGRLPDQAVTTAEMLQPEGYATAAFVASYVLHSKFGLNQGFDRYDDNWVGDAASGGGLRRQRDAREVIDAVIDWFESRNPGRWFCWVHLFDPHVPYVPHREIFGDRYLQHPYDGEIAYVDRELQRLFAYLSLQQMLEDTLVMVVGDHGEGLGQHDELEHGNLIYNTTLHVPLILNGKGVSPATRIAEPVSVIDLYATALQASGGSLPTDLLQAPVNLLNPDTLSADRFLYAETDNPMLSYGWSPLRGLIQGAWKYIRSSAPALYNLEQVPQETENLVSSQQTRAADMEQELARIEAAMMTMERAAADLTAEDRRALQSLGYTAGGWDVTGAMPEISSLPAPANMISTLAMIKQAKRLLRRRRYSEALMLFKKAVEQDPDNISFQFDLGKALYRARAYAQAGDILKHALETAPDYLDLDLRVRIHTLLAAVLMDSGQPEKALAYAEQALALDPESVNALNSTAWILSTHAWDASAHKQGLAYALQMMQLGAQYDISALDTLAAAYAANGDYSNAAVTAGRAWQMALDAGRKVLAKDIKQRLARYRAGRPFWADR